MREYALSQAQSQQMTFAGAPIARLIASWKGRRTVRQLQRYDDFMLRDIGLTRGDLRTAGALPLTKNTIDKFRD